MHTYIYTVECSRSTKAQSTVQYFSKYSYRGVSALLLSVCSWHNVSTKEKLYYIIG